MLKLKNWRKQTSLKIQFYSIDCLKQHQNPKKLHMTRSNVQCTGDQWRTNSTSTWVYYFIRQGQRLKLQPGVGPAQSCLHRVIQLWPLFLYWFDARNCTGPAWCGSSARFQFSYIEIVGRHPHQYFNICVSSVHHFNWRQTTLKLQHSRQNNGWCGSLQVQRESESTAKRFLELILKTNSRWRSCLIFVFSDDGKKSFKPRCMQDHII